MRTTFFFRGCCIRSFCEVRFRTPASSILMFRKQKLTPAFTRSLRERICRLLPTARFLSARMNIHWQSEKSGWSAILWPPLPQSMRMLQRKLWIWSLSNTNLCRWSHPFRTRMRRRSPASMSMGSSATSIEGRLTNSAAFKPGYKKDASITAMHHRTILDGGAYGGHGVASTFYTGILQPTTYKLPNYRFEAVRVFTNKAPCGPKRGHGTPQPRWAQEIQMDKIADQLELDPAEIRKQHAIAPNSITANWIRIGTLSLRQCIDKVVAGSGWKDKFRKLPYGKGIGIACSAYMTGTQTPIYYNKLPHSGVQLKLDRGGGVCVFCGSAEIGQGSDSILAYIVAEVLGIDPFDIRVVTCDTDLTPVDLDSYSSRVTLMTGNAAKQAAERAREILRQAVSEKLDVPGSRLSFADRRVFDAENPEKGMSFVDAVWLAEEKFGTIGSTGSYKPPASPGKYKGSTIGPSPAFTCTATVAEVDVNPETGIITV